MNYCAIPGLLVILMTQEEAERHARFAYRVPPENGLGWQPYKILIQDKSLTAYKAFNKTEDFKRWLGGLSLRPFRGWNRRSFRMFEII